MPEGSRPPGPSEGAYRASPAGEMLEVSAPDLAALDRLVNEERTRTIALFVVAVVALRGAQSAGGILPYVLVAAGGVVAAYALWLQAYPEGVGQALLRLDPAREIAAGGEIGVTILLRPRKRLDLDALRVRLFARGADVGLVKGEILHESLRFVGERCAIEGGRAVRFEARIPIPDDAPTSAPGKPVRWRVEVSAGEPSILSLARTIVVRPAGAGAPGRP